MHRKKFKKKKNVWKSFSKVSSIRKRKTFNSNLYCSIWIPIGNKSSKICFYNIDLSVLVFKRSGISKMDNLDLLLGEQFLNENLLGLKFQISPLAFFQCKLFVVQFCWKYWFEIIEKIYSEYERCRAVVSKNWTNLRIGQEHDSFGYMLRHRHHRSHFSQCN